ncbi:MAG: VTC domain-containing protein, partial [Clostridia bacterium]|nr:VTC domain-containing protein [Clostridia bacterium]
MSTPKFRHEYKYPITYADGAVLAGRLRTVLSPDPHAGNGCYTIRSLYFDDWKNKALFEKLDGTDPREKFRIRIYN